MRQACWSIRTLRRLLANGASLDSLVNSGQAEGAGYLLKAAAESTYLRLDGANDPLTNGLNVTGDVAATGLLQGGSLKIDGDTISGVLSGTATLDFGSIAASESADLAITVTGAAVGDPVFLGIPDGAISGGSGCDNVGFTTWVSAADTVTVRASNNDAAAAADLASGSFRATVLKY